MIYTDLKSFFRIIWKNKALTVINLSGLALGISGCIFISLYVQDELRYDAYHEKKDRIFRISTTIVSESTVDAVAISPGALAEALKQNFPEVEECVRFITMGKTLPLNYNGDVYPEKDLYKADAGVFDVFSYTLLKGDPHKALVTPRTIVLTETIAQKYFGDNDPMGETLTIGRTDYQVTGVMEDLPRNSDLRFSMLLSMDSSDRKSDWFDISYYSYVLFRKSSTGYGHIQRAFEEKLTGLVAEKMNKPLKDNNQNMTLSLHLQPLTKIHFENSLLYDTPKGNKTYVYIFTSVALLILLMACINYINFSIVQSMERSREVGIRKIVGATFRQLVVRYTGHSLFLTLLALMLGALLVLLLLPVFNAITSRNFLPADLLQPEMMLVMLAILITAGMLAGSYPAFYISSMKAVNALSGKVTSPGGQAVRKTSLVLQFIVSIGLLTGTWILYKQMNYVQQYDLGFRKKNVIVLDTPADTVFFERIETLRKALMKSSSIASVSITGLGTLPGDANDEERGALTLKSNGQDEVRMVNYSYIDAHYLPTLHIGLKEGRNYRQGNVYDRENSILINEALANLMGWKDPLEQKIVWRGTERTIIGVVRDIHYQSLYNPVQPQIFVPHEKRIGHVLISLNSVAHDHITLISDQWKKHFPDEPFQYRFLDDSVRQQYEKEQTAKLILSGFSALTIIISCFGLFGLASLSVYQRRKEIGIRKVIGAGFSSIVLLFAREYLVLVTLAIVIVSPVTWLVMDHWLESFLHHIPTGVTAFLATGFGFMVATLMTVVISIQKTAVQKCATLIRS